VQNKIHGQNKVALIEANLHLQKENE